MKGAVNGANWEALLTFMVGDPVVRSALTPLEDDAHGLVPFALEHGVAFGGVLRAVAVRIGMRHTFLMATIRYL